MKSIFQIFEESSSLNGANATYVENLYERFLEDPHSNGITQSAIVVSRPALVVILIQYKSFMELFINRQLYVQHYGSIECPI
ncbi:MAG: hypothetical protein FJ190_12520 [Gammaproteobacteria bacterium]|nr:hypothetical protein [Gammaproteobacteria bacterium]